ncbi:UDP-2,3-diacylglucosamine pyrophosphatase LpxH [Sporobacter termitidis DSM 10068]|uniref:UDP-2,3-diacylglucosamine pyrophosphatase LpxH n=1 Tax=Sporobacter termitidis DSM 10068 TaxID=1123282 RepID=A0A1M5W8W1_9FIRM|nr:metallophosphoesterase [Sporobacter termitidis]SHH83905.1 UDP-2,3-diacylglucosamine pyrophosphatase LpxH [Sporobacter termitidis DSM 10068]
MFSFNKRIDDAYEAALTVKLGDTSKFVIMSDVHRGGGNWADDFAKNQVVYYAALKSYNRQGYTYIELGDGDELWKYKRFSEITTVHKDVFLLLEQFYKDNRIYFVYGNHDIKKKYKPGMLAGRYDEAMKTKVPLFPGAKIYESILLRYGAAGRALFLLHGHQADFLNDRLWRLARFLVRHVWGPMELFGLTNDPTSAARNNKVKEKVEKRLSGWTKETGTLMLAGHTHRPVFPEPGEGKYFNDGSCVHPYSITGIEISLGNITLVKWGQKTHEDGTVYVGKDIIAGPHRLTEYFT